MTEIHPTCFNFLEVELLSQILPKSSEYEFTSDKIFRKREPPVCTCGCKCIFNGYNYARKRSFGKVKIGKYICPVCDNNFYEDKSYWKNILANWHETLTNLIFVLRYSHVAHRMISTITSFIIPYGKDTVSKMFNKAMDNFQYNVNKSILFVHYDEQHPKRGRNQKFRLTLISLDGKVIGDELYEDKKRETIKQFLLEHLDPSKDIVIITDCDKGYPNLFKEIWGNRVRHQKCLFHLNQLVCRDFGRYTSLMDEYNKYLILNIFYDRSSELKKLERLKKKMEEIKFKTNKEKWEWICKAKIEFWDFIRKRENRRRRKQKNLKQRTLKEAEENFAKIIFQKHLFPKKAKKRIEMIQENWDAFTNFYHVKGCPATNNMVENFYSTSLKTHRKKQFRTDRGLKNQMKVAAFKRQHGFEVKETLIEIFHKISLLAT